ncbi:single-stranded-DNA-specific exonuclease RecJ [Betaproteobacteria bacterium SCN2]|jgi:single-stranded-DNA-specific exonuclease|nr:single-stranded-DNA-specific exonuclease RecJ [Betaproteobacteria bacterium SCN2]
MPRILNREIDPDAYKSLTGAGVSPLLSRLYAARRVADAAELQPRLTGLLPFESMKGIRDMATELADGIEAGARFLIVADYDADGATACAVGVLGLRMLGADVDYLVPNRAVHGYGLSPAIVEEAARMEPDALITVDNGIAAIDGVAAANELGIPVYVTDHHLPGDTLPQAAGIVNPNQRGCDFPSKNLAGVGVMFYLLLALRAELRGRGAFDGKPEPDLRVLLDRVALGTVADVVKLDANNRILVNQGLQRIRAGFASPGIQALMQVAGRRTEKASVFDLGFMLGPRLNAAGRLEDMRLGIECLLAPNFETALPLAQRLHEINQSRKDIESDMKEQALALLEEVDCAGKHGLAIHHPEWHAGVIGILASRLKEKYHRPVFAFAPGGNGELKGSGRSIPALHLRDALDWIDRQHPGLILKFGGHAMAAGLTIREEGFAEFQQAFEALAQAWLTPADLDEVIETDGKLAPGELDFDVVKTLENAVWGQGFPAPLFQGEFAVLNQRVVGEKHLKLDVSLQDARYEAMAFFHNEPLPDRFVGVYAPMLNEFNGRLSIQLKLQYWESLQ